MIAGKTYYFILNTIEKSMTICSAKTEAREKAKPHEEIYSMILSSEAWPNSSTVRQFGTRIPTKKVVGRPRMIKEPWADRDGNPHFKLRFKPDLWRRIEAAGGSAYIRSLIEIDSQRWDSPIYEKPAALRAVEDYEGAE